MKRIILTFLLAICFTMLSAQNNLDTIYPQNWRHYHFDYQWWNDPDSVMLSWQVHFFHWWDDEIVEAVKRIYSNDSLRIIGIAGCATHADHMDCVLAGTYTNDDEEYLRLYKPIGDSMALIGEGTFDINHDTAYLLCIDNFEHRQEGWFHAYDYCGVFEVFFDTTQIVTDSFYVGLTMHNNWRDPENNDLFPTQPVVPYWYNTEFYAENVSQRSTWHYKEKHHDNPTIWHNRDSEQGLCVWPILEDDWPIEKRCPQPGNLNLITIGGGSSVTWDGPANQTQWQLSYSSVADQPDSGTIVDLNSNYWYHSFTDDTPQYIYIRGYCHNERCWSLWSDPIIYGEDTNSSDGIRHISTLESQTNLYPNPATNSVTVTSGFSLKKVELCSIQGQILLSQEAIGHAASFDLSSLEPGTYLMIIHTARGRTVKRIVKK